MSEAEPQATLSKKNISGIAESIGDQKDERIIRESLRDIMLFNNALESEMKNMMVAVHSGKPLDHDLFDKMTRVKEKYNYAMSGLKAFNDEMQRIAFVALADAIQELMVLIHTRRHAYDS